MYNYKYVFRNTDFNYLKCCNLGKQMLKLACNLPQFYSYSQSIYTQAVEWIAS